LRWFLQDDNISWYDSSYNDWEFNQEIENIFDYENQLNDILDNEIDNFKVAEDVEKEKVFLETITQLNNHPDYKNNIIISTIYKYLLETEYLNIFDESSVDSNIEYLTKNELKKINKKL
jgi:hypothetical protein